MSRYKTKKRARRYRKKEEGKVSTLLIKKYKETINFVVGILLLTILSFVLVWIKYKIQ